MEVRRKRLKRYSLSQKDETHKVWKVILLVLDRLGIPLYYHPSVLSIGKWRFTKEQKGWISSLLLSHPLEGESLELMKRLSLSSHYNIHHKRFLNSVLLQHWNFYGRESLDITGKWNPYPPHLQWKFHLDNLFKWELETIYEYE